MTEPTDTNQASEVKLDTILVELCKNTQTDYGYQKLVPSETAKSKQAIQSLIRTEKLKLLAEVRELLIDRIPVYDGDDSFGKEYQAGYNSMAHATRTMQLQQSAELTKLEAEL